MVHDTAVRADHVVAMKADRIAAQGPPETVCTSQVLSDIYDKDLRGTRIDGKPLVLHRL